MEGNLATTIDYLAKAVDEPIELFTLALCIATFLLWVSTRALVTSARDTALRQLRAYVLVDSAVVLDISSVQKQPLYREALEGEVPFSPNQPVLFVTIRNSGDTPAYEVSHWGAIDFIEPRHESTLRPSTDDQKAVRSVIASLGTTQKILPFPRKLTDAELVELRRGVKRLYAYGIVTYRDAFKVVRTTSYRLSYSGAYPPAGAGNLDYCSDGNESD